MTECQSCGAATDAVICHREAADLQRRMREAATLWDDELGVEVTVTRQARMGDPTPRAGRPAPAAPIRPDGGRLRHYADQVDGTPTGLPFNWRASDAVWAVRNTLTTWARDIAEATGAELPRDMDDLMRWVAGRLDWLRYEQQAIEAFDQLSDATATMWRIVDRPPERVDAGLCGAVVDGVRCEHWLTTPHGAIYIRCRVCGTTHDITVRQTRMLIAARDHRGTATECARWLSRLGLETTAAMVRGLAHRRRIIADAHGRYRLGDVEAVRREIKAREAA